MRRNGITMLVIALLLLAAYGGPATSSASPTTPEQPAAAPALAQDAVTIQFLTIDDEDMLIATQQMIEAFKASDPKYANVTVEVQSVPFEGNQSAPLTFKAKNGYTGDPPQSRADMLKNRYFQDVRVRVFAKHSASQWVEIATLDIPRQLLAQ